jgi:methyl-accepting chemotaxis protein
MKRQTEAFQALGTELATAIDNALTNRMSPVVSVLGSINDSIEQFGKGGFNQISQDLGKALGEHAGREMQELGQTLAVMATKFDALSTGLADVPSTLENTLREMRQQFESEQDATRRRQAEAGDQMSDQLSKLAERLEGVTGHFAEDLAGKLQKTIEVATDSSGEALGKAFANFGEKMSQSTDDLVQRLALLANNAGPLSEAMTRAAEATNQQVDRLELAG